jgi:hypothetical protein
MAKRVAFNVAGWALLMLGCAGLVLPVLPGVVFLIVGLSFLSLEYEWARRWMGPLLRRFPAPRRNFRYFLPAIRNLSPQTYPRKALGSSDSSCYSTRFS